MQTQQDWNTYEPTEAVIACKRFAQIQTTHNQNTEKKQKQNTTLTRKLIAIDVQEKKENQFSPVECQIAIIGQNKKDSMFLLYTFCCFSIFCLIDRKFLIFKIIVK